MPELSPGAENGRKNAAADSSADVEEEFGSYTGTFFQETAEGSFLYHGKERPMIEKPSSGIVMHGREGCFRKDPPQASFVLKNMF